MEENRKQWFLDRIGKRVYPQNPLCPCDVCLSFFNKGYFISDKMIADDLSEGEALGKIEGESNRFFDSIKERDEFENTLTNGKSKTNNIKRHQSPTQTDR